MTNTTLAHFDGKNSLVLDEPVDLPVGIPLRVRVEAVTLDNQTATEDMLSAVIVGLDPALSQAIASAPEFASENF